MRGAPPPPHARTPIAIRSSPLFRRSGALLDGHFRLSSGLHSNGYLQCALVLQDPADGWRARGCWRTRVRELSPAAVLSPALGGVIIGHEVARALGVRAIFAERQDGRLPAAARVQPRACASACWWSKTSSPRGCPPGDDGGGTRGGRRGRRCGGARRSQRRAREPRRAVRGAARGGPAHVGSGPCPLCARGSRS